MRQIAVGGQRIRSTMAVLVVVLLVGDALALWATDSPGGDAVPFAPGTTVASTPVTAESASTTAPPSTTPRPRAAAPKARASTTASSTSTTLVFPETTSGDLVYQVTVAPRCVNPGQDITATFRVPPNAGVIALPVYAGGPRDGDDQQYTGTADENGIAIYTWRAMPSLGDGILSTAARDTATDKGGMVSVRFRVVAVGTPC